MKLNHEDQAALDELRKSKSDEGRPFLGLEPRRAQEPVPSEREEINNRHARRRRAKLWRE